MLNAGLEIEAGNPGEYLLADAFPGPQKLGHKIVINGVRAVIKIQKRPLGVSEMETGQPFPPGGQGTMGIEKPVLKAYLKLCILRVPAGQKINRLKPGKILE